MKRILHLALLVTFLFVPAASQGDAVIYGKKDMVRQAGVIAIVNIFSIEPATVKGGRWTYSQVASASVERIIKGDVPSNIKLYGGEDFICAQCHFKTGKFLLFLQRDGELLIGSNWNLSIRPISGDLVEWYKDDKTFDLENKPLESVLVEIEELLGEGKEAENK